MVCAELTSQSSVSKVPVIAEPAIEQPGEVWSAMRLLGKLLVYSITSISPLAGHVPLPTVQKACDKSKSQQTIPLSVECNVTYRPDTTLVRWHVSQVQDEESMSPALLALKSDAETSQVCRWVQNLAGLNSPRDAGVGDIEHTIGLSCGLIDVVHIAKGRIP